MRMKKAQAVSSPSSVLFSMVIFSMVIIGMSYWVGNMASSAHVSVNEMHYIQTYDYINNVSSYANASQQALDTGNSGAIQQFTGYLQNGWGATKMVLKAPYILFTTLGNISSDIIPLPPWFFSGVYALIGILLLSFLISIAVKQWW
jgi:hypothetical protein